MEVENQKEPDHDVSIEETQNPDMTPDPKVIDPGAGPTPETVGEGEPAPYQPNYSYKVLKEQREIPERYRSLITDEASEKEIRDIFERADGIDAVKAHRDRVLEENETFKKDWVPYIQETTAALKAMQKGDLPTFFKKVGLSDQQIFAYTQQQLELRKDPEKLSAYERGREQMSRSEELEQQNEELRQRYEQLAVRQRESELSYALNRAEIREAVNHLDSRLGAGSFRNECIRVAQQAAAQGQDPSAEAVADYVAKLSGWSPSLRQSVPYQPEHSQTPGTGIREKKPTIPQMSGNGTSPARQIPKTMEDLWKLKKQAEAEM